jgi:hypothetical protein
LCLELAGRMTQKSQKKMKEEKEKGKEMTSKEMFSRRRVGFIFRKVNYYFIYILI